jgi:hypothetical protein
MTLLKRKTFFDLASKLSALELLFAGPMLVSDAMRPVIGKWPAIVLFGVLPIVFFYMGASNLAETDDFPPRRALLRIGFLGVFMVAPMNVYAIQSLVQGGPKPGALTVFAVVLCPIVLVTYVVLATRELRKPPPAKAPFQPNEDASPID